MFLEEGGTTLEIKNYNQKKKIYFCFFFGAKIAQNFLFFFFSAP